MTKIFVQEVVKDVSVQIRGIFFVQGNEKECGESGAICNLIDRLLMNIYSVISVMCDVLNVAAILNAKIGSLLKPKETKVHCSLLELKTIH